MPPALKTSSPVLTAGVKYMLMSTLSFAVMNVFIKKVSDFPAMEIVFFRCLISMFICLAILKREKADWRGSNRTLLMARGIFGTFALYTFFLTLHEIPLGTAVTIQYLSPIFTTVIAIFLLKEKVKPLQWLFFFVSFAGILIIKGFDSRISLFMLLVGIASALASGFAYNMVRSLREKEHTMVVVLHFQLVGTVAGFVFSLFNWRMPHGIEWFYLFMIGICTQLGQVNLTKALQRERMASVSIYNYLGILYALLFGFIFFGERYAWLALSGIVLVIGGVLLNYFYQRKENRLVAEEELTTIEE
jgi:drug/metabolite transporter (DMT)-like permease